MAAVGRSWVVAFGSHYVIHLHICGPVTADGSSVHGLAALTVRLPPLADVCMWHICLDDAFESR